MRRGEPPIEPLYTQADAERVADQFVKVEYNQSFEPVPGVNAHLVDAGHILGSASVVLDIQENHRSYRLWFSGDIGRRFLPLLKDPTMPEAADYLIMECTYGDKSHDDPQLAYDELRETVQRTVKRGGKVIIPAFAVGRTQELVFELNEMMTTGQIPSIPVFVDSPLAVNATQVFQEFPQYFDEQTHEFIRQGRHPALNFKQLTYIHSVDESKALNNRHDPMVIISASGMAEAGRILHHLATISKTLATRSSSSAGRRPTPWAAAWPTVNRSSTSLASASTAWPKWSPLAGSRPTPDRTCCCVTPPPPATASSTSSWCMASPGRPGRSPNCCGPKTSAPLPTPRCSKLWKSDSTNVV